MYREACNRGVCCNGHGPYDAFVEYTKCSCPEKYDCDGEGEDEDGEGGEERGGGRRGGCAHCQACCSYEESDSFLTYCRGEGKRERCMESGCCDGGDEEEDDEGDEGDGDGKW